MSDDLQKLQKEICRSVSVAPFDVFPGDKLGISQTAIEGLLPLNGLRHPVEKGSCGWYIWGGEELSSDDDFFQPVHVAHLKNDLPLAQKFLLLPPGWRFLTDGVYEDIWFDPDLLQVEA